MIELLTPSGLPCRLFGADHPSVLLLQPSARHENATLEAEATLTPVPFVLATVELADWIADLMPWPDGNISRDPAAGGRAQGTLDELLLELLPELERRFGLLPVILGGYSLGGLFALWAACQTDRFCAVAAASPSVWIRDWLPFARTHAPLVDRIYLSLGEREEYVRNQAIARVGDCLRDYYALLRQQLGPSRCTLAWEPGNHFTDNEGRLARAFAWCLHIQ